MDPRQWLDDYESRIADLAQKSAALQENYAAAHAKVTSPDGAVTITVGPNGGLQDIELGHRACDLGPARLTAVIMQTARTAQRQAAAKVVEAFEPIGAGTEAMQFVLDSIPDDEDEEVPVAAENEDFGQPEPEPERPAPPQRPPYQQQVAPRPPARPRHAVEDDDENQPW
ncbi:YbaB/EbfC family nucleoid-associated protein [Actinosynnema sp. NPDC020468]|uniref:YbaB/EbfC family nucleoid-associated protein n=1 Tax=Actinosynnema sp. NPDC020468 TaxID=3154488 RepID=UPI0033C510D0